MNNALRALQRLMESQQGMVSISGCTFCGCRRFFTRACPSSVGPSSSPSSMIVINTGCLQSQAHAAATVMLVSFPHIDDCYMNQFFCDLPSWYFAMAASTQGNSTCGFYDLRRTSHAEFSRILSEVYHAK